MVRRVMLQLNPWIFLMGACLLLTGCPNPNTYGTPRTTPKGRISHTVSAEAYGFSVDNELTGETDTLTTPVPPSYTIRFGVADQVDVGARVANFSSVAGDVKWNFLKSDSFDMALDPGLQWFTVASINAFYFNAPVMLGINLAEPVSLVLVPGVTYTLVTGDVDPTDDDSFTADGLFFRGGLGFNFRLSEGFALHPEVTFMKSLTADDSALLYQMGLGFNFGKLPSFAGL